MKIIWILLIILAFLLGWTKTPVTAQEGLQMIIDLPFFKGITPKIYRFIDRDNTCYIGYGDSGRLAISCVKSHG